MSAEAEQKHMGISFIRESYQTKAPDLVINEWILNILSKV